MAQKQKRPGAEKNKELCLKAVQKQSIYRGITMVCRKGYRYQKGSIYILSVFSQGVRGRSISALKV